MRKILKASAGTGKTYRLALEYVISLIKGEKQNNIVVMTFTRKATSEIKERIIEFLYDLNFVEEKAEKLKFSIKKIYPEIKISKIQVKEIYNEIILNKDTLKIYTIDSFKNIIFKKSISKMLNISSFEIIEDFENEEILKKCFEKITMSKKNFKLFERFFENNLERNVENHIKTLREIIDYRWKYILIEKEDRSKYKNIEEINQIDEMIKILEEIRKYKKKENVPLEEHLKAIYKSYLKIETFNEKEEFILKNWNKILDDNYIFDGKKIRAGKDETILELFGQMENLMRKLKKEISKRLYNSKVIFYEKEIFSFLEFVYEVYDEIKFKEYKFTHSDISNYTLNYLRDQNLNLVNENKITNYMKEILESEASTIFIDEFQDTSIVQWEILKVFIESSKNVICVGDEKQSIYGWRDGDKNLFTKLPNIINAEVENLDICYRSEGKILEFINSFFENYSNISPEIEWDFSPVKGNNKKNKGFVGIYNEKLERDENYAYEKVVKLIKLNFKNSLNGIGILARSNSTLNKMALVLSENRIPYFLESNLSIFDSRAVRPLVTFLKYLANDNKFYLVEFLRDDLIFLGDKELKDLLLNLDDADNFSFIKKEEENLYEKIKKYKKTHEEKKLKINTIVEELIREFGVIEKYNSESDIKNLYKFVEKCKGFANISDLLKEIEKNKNSNEYKQESLSDYKGVVLMTVHKAKGLEFDTVFYIHKENKINPRRGLQFNIRVSDDYNKIEEYLVIESKYEKIFGYLEDKHDYLQEKKIKAKEEELNNLYVALTRPKKNLFILIDKIFKNSEFKEILDELYFKSCSTYNLGEIILKEKQGKEIFFNVKNSEENEIKKIKLDFGEISYEKKDTEDSIKNHTQKISRYRKEKEMLGSVVHYFFENIKYGEKEEINLAIEETVSKYGILFGEEYLRKIFSKRFIENNILKNSEIFSRKWDIIYNEYSIYSEEEKSVYRIDRLMIKKDKLDKKGEIFIVDYKTGGYEEEQIEHYEKLVSKSLEKIGELNNFKIKTKYLEIDM